MKKLFIILFILISFTTKAQTYDVYKVESSVKTYWDLDFIVERSKQVRGLKIKLFFFGMTDVFGKLYLFDTETCWSQYKDGKFVKTTWLATTKKGEKYKIVYTPTLVRVILNEDGVLLSTDYYIK
jgi:hypothetical protein